MTDGGELHIYIKYDYVQDCPYGSNEIEFVIVVDRYPNVSTVRTERGIGRINNYRLISVADLQIPEPNTLHILSVGRYILEQHRVVSFDLEEKTVRCIPVGWKTDEVFDLDGADFAVIDHTIADRIVERKLECRI